MSLKKRGGAVAVQPAITEIREEIAWLKKQLGRLMSELESEKKQKGKASFGRDKLLSLNTKLMDELKSLKEETKPRKTEDRFGKVSFFNFLVGYIC